VKGRERGRIRAPTPRRVDAGPFLAGLACALFAGCGSEAAPRWISLARGFRPRPLLPLVQEWQREAGLDPGSCREDRFGVRVEHELARSAWQPLEAPDTFAAALPGGAFERGVPSFLLLVSESVPLGAVGPERELAVHTYRPERGRVVLRMASGEAPPLRTVLAQRLESGRAPADGVWQVRIGNRYGAGLSVWSGLSEEVMGDVPQASRLSFEARYAASARGPVTLRVRLDGELVHQSIADSVELETRGSRVSAALPERARVGARFSFEAEGPPGQALFLRPVVGPAEFGRPAARPWKEARADVVLFLADTFRADGLALAGGAADLAPGLNAFAEGALRFQNARSNAAWTLPSIGSLLSGLAPGQHTANDPAHALPDELPTVVEGLARAGYRTGAITDAAFFTPTHGLDQGFETFVMNDPAAWDLDWTVERAREFLAEDDGRPVFLLVHTYRTHQPYRVGAQEDLRPWIELLASGCVLMKARGEMPRAEWKARLEACRERYAALYREGVRDLDRGFGLLLAELERVGIAGSGYVIFTSDHGEALGENEDIFHDGKLWDSKLRIPLLVRGPGLAARDVEPAVTLLDLAPTLAGIAGLPRDPRWSAAASSSPATPRPSRRGASTPPTTSLAIRTRSTRSRARPGRASWPAATPRWCASCSSRPAPRSSPT
jgi:arylsulfatase A-like enzyme